MGNITIFKNSPRGKNSVRILSNHPTQDNLDQLGYRAQAKPNPNPNPKWTEKTNPTPNTNPNLTLNLNTQLPQNARAPLEREAFVINIKLRFITTKLLHNAL